MKIEFTMPIEKLVRAAYEAKLLPQEIKLVDDLNFYSAREDNTGGVIYLRNVDIVITRSEPVPESGYGPASYVGDCE